ncbi:hypothetical protein QBC32DRAFT_144068 [Pseudoneurospora amorphoporcata]|uniref:Uncharacterized protein n=1 Tax=Pseudoneurospora amorphoporcata TaxID=241081 RepID=A0AAN6SAK0_9PEZI|nr:hypothetical protein QBC32DRAFT_144068 [Pseudoneurospora amorphoporcata]
MGRLSQITNRLRGKHKPDSASKAASGVSSPPATPPTAPALPSASAPASASASEIPSVPTIIAHPPPEQIVLSAPQPPNPTPASPAPTLCPATTSDMASSPSHDVGCAWLWSPSSRINPTPTTLTFASEADSPFIEGSGAL